MPKRSKSSGTPKPATEALKGPGQITAFAWAFFVSGSARPPSPDAPRFSCQTTQAGLIFEAMTYVKLLLGGLSALFLSGFVLMVITAFRDMSHSNARATGLAAVVGNSIEGSVRSPVFWLLAILFFAMFFATGRLSSTVFRVVLFWFPAIGILMFGLGLLGWFAMVISTIRHPPGQ